ncbi:ATPase [Shewanella sp. 10N.7]|uniref:ATP-binding protein n=1 Tax=Shewanella sp. 10N.7 TaxID=2885093 RepID=UPI001E491EC9|nr:ATP-binding protein [Shewanella sp. 10N.7]MCC4832452.1 ATPase [Shewanella sp. 10N.7]
MKISQKLFLAFVGLTSVVLIATLSLARWGFDQGFISYTNSLQQERLEELAVSYSELYQQSAYDWNNVSKKKFAQIIRQFTPLHGPFEGAERKGPPPRPKHKPPRFDGPPPHLTGEARGDLPPHLRDSNQTVPPKRRRPVTALYSISGQLLAGDKFDILGSTISVDVTYNDQVIATLYTKAVVKVNSISAEAFSKQQLWTSIWIGLLCLILASLISWVLARLLLIPVREVVNGISHLSKGNYSERFKAAREDELGLLMNDIDHLAMTLDKNRTAKNRWFADISHELRTPLSILCGEIDAIKAGIRPFNQQQLTSLEQEVMRIKHLVDDLYQLSLSDVGGLKYHFEPTDITLCIAETLNSLADKVSDKGLSLNFIHTKTITINGDKMRLQQLLYNVILNSVAYTDSPGSINIDLIEELGSLSILINDTKPGVPLDECELLFDALHRQDSSRVRRSNGAGLGLTICRNIVEAHNGHITARPSNLGGLCIEISLPIL